MVQQQIATEIQYNWIHTIRKLLFAHNARKHKLTCSFSAFVVGLGVTFLGLIVLNHACIDWDLKC